MRDIASACPVLSHLILDDSVDAAQGDVGVLPSLGHLQLPFHVLVLEVVAASTPVLLITSGDPDDFANVHDIENLILQIEFLHPCRLRITGIDIPSPQFFPAIASLSSVRILELHIALPVDSTLGLSEIFLVRLVA